MTDETSDAFAGWEKDDEGNVSAFPYGGHATALVAGKGCILFLQFWQSAEAIGTPEHIQLGMLPAQARELGKALLRMADMAESGPAESDPTHKPSSPSLRCL
jgi:hypothetical protein